MWITEARLEQKLKNKRKNAGQRGLSCQLTLEDLREIFARNGGVCDYTGMKFKEADLQFDSSIERIDSNKGYVVGNICLVSIQANVLKDTLIDKQDIKGFKISRTDIPLIAAITVKVNNDYLEHLKTKYDPRVPYNPETDPYKGYFDDLTGKKIVSTIEPVKIIETSQEKPIMSQDQWTAEKKAANKESNKVPDDVRIATYYSALAGAATKSGMTFSITYAEFKGRFARKTCAFSGQALTPENKFMLVLDRKKPLCKENVAVVQETFGHKLTKMSEEMGMSVEQLAKMFKRLA